MKHCICLEDNRILYVCGTVSSHGFKIKYADMAVFSVENKNGIIRNFVKKNHLNRKNIYLALDSGILFSMINLPNAKPKILQEMVHNELTGSIGNDQELIVCLVPFKVSPDGMQTMVLTFTMFEKEFREQVRILKEAGLHLSKAYVLANCIGEMMQLIYPHKKLMIQIEAMENQLRLLLIDNGCCILARNIRLNVRHFCETSADSLLYDEIAEQVSKMIQFHAGRNKEDEIEQIIFLSDVVRDKEKAARSIGELLNIPCEYPECSFATVKHPDPAMVKYCYHALAVLVKASGRQKNQVDLLAAGRYSRNRQVQNGMNRGSIRFSLVLSANVVVLSGISIGLYCRNINYVNQIAQMTEYVDSKDRQMQYQEAIQKVKELAAAGSYQEALTNSTAIVQEQNVLQLKDYETIRLAMTSGMTIEGMRYDESSSIFEIDFFVASAQEVTDFIERIREYDHFDSVSHTYWRKEQGTDGQFKYATTVLSGVKRGNDHAAD